MGLRGPVPTPTAILNRRGSWRGKERKTEPQPERSRPVCPASFRAMKTAAASDALKMWKKLVPMLGDMGVLTRVDGSVLERYCVLMVKWRHNEAKPTEKSFDMCLRLNEALLKLESQFGLSPAARTRITVESKREDTDDKARFFGPKVAS